MPAHKKFPALGRGLDAIISTDEEIHANGSSSINEVPVDQIKPTPNQPRREFDEAALQELADSIRQIGIIQPITLRKHSDDTYEIIAGERRWRASQLAGLRTVPAYIRTASDETMMQMALIENIQRENLNPIEVASAIDFLVKQHDLTHDEVARRIGKSRPAVTNTLRLLTLPSSVQDKLRSGKLQMGHARALAAIKDDAEIERLADRAASQGWSVRETEKRASAANEPKSN